MSYKYKGINFPPPKVINNVEIIYITNYQKQIEQFRQHGILKLLEIEPIDVIKNFIQLKIDVSLSIKTTEDNYQDTLNSLTLTERKTISSIITEDKSVDLYVNIESHIFNFLYDCDKSEFILIKHQKNIQGNLN